MRDIGRDAGDHAVDLRCRALVEGGEAQSGRLAEVQLVDILRRDLRLDRQRIGLRHDQHDRVAGSDDPADRVHRELMHHAVLRRADVDALELVLGRHLALDELADLARRPRAARCATSLLRSWSIWMICSSISPILPRDCAVAEIDCARSPLSRAASRSSEISRLICIRFLFQSARTPSSSRWISSISSAFASCSAVYPRISSSSWAMRSLSCDFLPEPGAAPQFEQLAFAVDGSRDVGFVRARQQCSSGRRSPSAPSRSLASRGLARIHLVEALGDDGEIGPRDGVVEPQHDLAAANTLRRRAPAARRRCRRSGAAPS